MGGEQGSATMRDVMGDEFDDAMFWGDHRAMNQWLGVGCVRTRGVVVTQAGRSLVARAGSHP